MTLYSITEYEFCCSFIFAILKWTNSQPTAYRDCLPEEKSILFFVDRLMLLKKVLKNCLSWTEITFDDIIYGWHFEQHCYNKVAFSIIGNIQMIKNAGKFRVVSLTYSDLSNNRSTVFNNHTGWQIFKKNKGTGEKYPKISVQVSLRSVSSSIKALHNELHGKVSRFCFQVSFTGFIYINDRKKGLRI